MIKHLILPILLLTSLAMKAQLRTGIAVNYIHITAPSYENMGTGSGWGPSLFFRFPVSKNKRWQLDASADLASGHTSFSYERIPAGGPGSGSPFLTHENRAFIYLAVPVHLVYSLPFRNGRGFAGPGFCWSYMKQDASLGSFDDATRTSMLAVSARAGVQLFQAVVLSGEFRPWIALFNKPDTYVRYTNPTNMFSVKLGYEFGALKQFPHSHPNS